MPRQSEILTWGGMPHSLELSEDERGTHGVLTIVKPKGTQVLPFDFPEGIALHVVRDAWERQGRAWVDLFPSVKTENSLFAVVRVIDLGTYRLLWYILHVQDAPQDAVAVLAKPQA